MPTVTSAELGTLYANRAVHTKTAVPQWLLKVDLRSYQSRISLILIESLNASTGTADRAILPASS
jgi:hypothetical protein